MAELVTDKLERTLQEAPNADVIRSYTKPGESLTLLELKDSTPPKDVPATWYQVRKRIADNMTRSKFTATHFTYVEEMDVTELVALRGRARAKAFDCNRHLGLAGREFNRMGDAGCEGGERERRQIA